MYGLEEIKKSKGMHMVHFNVRSLTSKWENFKIHFMNSNLHVLGLSETWLNDSLPNEMFDLAGKYTLYRNDRNWTENNSNTTKKGGGVGLYIDSNLHSSDANSKRFNCSTKHIESQWVSIKQKHNKLILIGNMYRPPQGDIDNFIEYLENVFDEIDFDGIELFLMGDLNIDFMDKKDAKCRKLLDLIKPLGLRQIIKEPTRLTQGRNSCLDLCITNCDNISKSGVCDINISDHLPILLTRKRVKKVKKKCNFIGRSYRRYNKLVFQQLIRDADWNAFDNSITATAKWNCLLQTIRENIDRMCPLKTFKIKQDKEPWLSNQLIELIKDKDYALKRAKSTKDPVLWNEAKRLRNNCTRRLRDARADYIKENLENNMGNQKKFWKNIQNVIPSSKKKNIGNFKLTDQVSGIDIDENDTAQYINDFFVNIGPNLASKCDQPWRFDGNPCPNNIDSIFTDVDEIIILCKDINVNKSSCIEHLSSEIIRDAFLAVPEKIVELFNLSFALAEIPSEWKIARVTPLPKAGNSCNVGNLRPVSLLPLTSKLIEKIAHNRIYKHCDDNNILDERQGGFRPNHSTCKTTAYFLNDIYQAMNDNKVLIATYIDAMKAFDTVNHKILLKKAECYGITGLTLDWLRNYLTERYQCTLANNIISDRKLITCGVPQGSVCGPLLFLIYINDISNVLEHCKVSLYADDTVIYIENSNVNNAVALLQCDLNNLSGWCTRNKLTINSKKTKYCIYGMRSNVKKSKTINTVLSLNSNILDRVCSYKYLGFILDDHLTFNKHISELCKIVSHKLYLLAKVRRYLTTQASLNVFKTMILSLFEYGDIIFSGTTVTNVNKIDNLFYRGLRICLNFNFTLSKEELCDECHIAPLSDRRDLHLLLFMHRLKNCDNLLKKRNIATRLHQAPVFWCYKPNNEKARLNVFYRGAISWNGLLANERNLDFNEFKKHKSKYHANV